MDMQKMMKLGALITHYFEIERYTAKDGTVWIGQGEAPDEVWIVESGSDAGYMTKDEMVKKMCSELLEEEFPASDEGYEYAVQRTDLGFNTIVGDLWGLKQTAERRLSAEELRQAAREDGGRVKTGTTFKLVKRRKAGPVQDA